MKILRFVAGLVIATGVHALGSRLLSEFPAAVDLFLVLAVYNTLSSPLGWSMVGGAVAGLARDALSGGLYGLHGFADTFVAYLAARLQQHLVIHKPVQVGLLLALAAAIQLMILAALLFLMVPGAELPGLGALAARMASSGLLGWLVFVLTAKARTSTERWREQRRRRLRMAAE